MNAWLRRAARAAYISRSLRRVWRITTRLSGHTQMDWVSYMIWISWIGLLSKHHALGITGRSCACVVRGDFSRRMSGACVLVLQGARLNLASHERGGVILCR